MPALKNAEISSGLRPLDAVGTRAGRARSLGERTRGAASVTRVLDGFAQTGGAQTLNTAVSQTDVALLLVLGIHPTRTLSGQSRRIRAQ